MVEFIVICLLVWFIFHIADRFKNPEKWKRIDLTITIDLYILGHQDAFERIPESEWIVMSNISKANVFGKREKMKREFLEFPQAIRDAIKERYPFDDTFQGVD